MKNFRFFCPAWAIISADAMTKMLAILCKNVYHITCKGVLMNAHKKAEKALEEAGYVFKRHGANHDIYFNAQKGVMIPLKRHDFDEGDLRYIKDEIKKGERK